MNKISELRKSKRLSQKALAEFVGVTQATISKYELDQINIPPEALAKLCTAFNVTADYLLGFSEENTKSPAAYSSEAKSDSVVLSEREPSELFTQIQEANSLFLKLDPAQKAQALAFLQFLADSQSKEPDNHY